MFLVIGSPLSSFAGIILFVVPKIIWLVELFDINVIFLNIPRCVISLPAPRKATYTSCQKSR